MADTYEDLLGLAPAAPPAAELVPAAAGGEMAIGAYEGATRYNRELVNWNPTLGSADLDIISEKPIGDARARDMLRNDAFVQGGMSLHKDNIVGAQFMLNAKPSSAVLFGQVDEVWESEFQEEVEETFHLCAESPDNLFDAARQNTFTEMVRMAVGINVMGGEILATAEWKKDGRPFNTAIQMVDPDRLSTPTMPFSVQIDPNLRAGIRKDDYGVPLSYFIKNRHPNDLPRPFVNPMEYWKWTEVAARKPWGRLQVIHIFTQMRAAQTRGVSAMVAALKAMRITHQFRDVTLQNAVTQALYAAAITSDLDTEAVFQRLGAGATAEDYQSAIANYMRGYYGVIGEFVGNSKSLQVDGVRIPHLPPGSKLDIISPSKGGPLGMDFERSLLRYIAATLNVSYEQLSKDYSNTSYSSARASMTETWKSMQALKKEGADRFATQIYRLWLEEMVASDQFKTFPKSKAAMLYGTGDGTPQAPLNLKWEALARCDWIGASRGQIDELKETQAAVLRVQNGLSTYEAEISRLGGDWRKQFRQMSRERKMAKDLELPFAMEPPADTTNTTNALSGNKSNAKGVGSSAALFLDAPTETSDDDQ